MWYVTANFHLRFLRNLKDRVVTNTIRNNTRNDCEELNEPISNRAQHNHEEWSRWAATKMTSRWQEFITIHLKWTRIRIPFLTMSVNNQKTKLPSLTWAAVDAVHLIIYWILIIVSHWNKQVEAFCSWCKGHSFFSAQHSFFEYSRHSGRSKVWGIKRAIPFRPSSFGSSVVTKERKEWILLNLLSTLQSFRSSCSLFFFFANYPFPFFIISQLEWVYFAGSYSISAGVIKVIDFCKKLQCWGIRRGSIDCSGQFPNQKGTPSHDDAFISYSCQRTDIFLCCGILPSRAAVTCVNW